MGLLLASGIIGLISGGLSAVSSIYNRKVQDQETRIELNQKLSELQTSQTNLTESYNLATAQADSQTKQANDLIKLQAQQTEATRDSSLKIASKSSALQDQLALSQVAQLQVQASQAEGQAVQSAAQSGFRGTGSALNNIKETARSSNSSVRQALLQRNITRFSDYSSASQNFTSANNQLEIYQRNIENNNADLKRDKESLALEYQQKFNEYTTQMEDVNEDLAYMDSSEYRAAQVLGGISDIFGGISTGSGTQSGVYKLGTAFGIK